MQLANQYSQYDFYISVAKDLVYKHLNLTKNTIHFIIFRKPELLLPNESPFEKWSPKESLTSFFTSKFFMDIDFYPQSSYLRNENNDTNMGFLYFNGKQDLSKYNTYLTSIPTMF